MGRRSASSVSLRNRFVTGTSAVGASQKSVFSILNKSSANFGNCPVPNRLAELIRKGGSTSV